MTKTKTLKTLLVTALIGSITFLVTAPKKITKSRVKTAKTSTQNGIDDKENLFI